MWHKRGVRIFNLQSLHAKVFAFRGAAFIGSSNASVTSRDRLIEAGVWTTERALAESAWAFVEGHCHEEVEENFLKKLTAAYRPPTGYPLQADKAGGGSSRAKKISRGQDEAPLHLINLRPTNFTDAEQAAADRAEASGRKRLGNGLKAALSPFTWPGNPGRFKVGDLVLARVTDTAARSEKVEPWARIVGIHKVRGKDRQAIVTATLPTWKEMELQKFTRAMGNQMTNFLKQGGRSRLATSEERSMVLAVWNDKRAKLMPSSPKT